MARRRQRAHYQRHRRARTARVLQGGEGWFVNMSGLLHGEILVVDLKTEVQFRVRRPARFQASEPQRASRSAGGKQAHLLFHPLLCVHGQTVHGRLVPGAFSASNYQLRFRVAAGAALPREMYHLPASFLHIPVASIKRCVLLLAPK